MTIHDSTPPGRRTPDGGRARSRLIAIAAGFLGISAALAVSSPWGATILRAKPAAPAREAAAPVGEAAPEALGTFPLKIAKNKRHLLTASGKPFLIHGDTAWSLIGQLDRRDTKRYLDDRRGRGFNTILVNLLEHRFSSNAPANAYGEQPFLTPGDFTRPNPKYFAHVDWVIKQAAQRGILVLLTPAYLGFGGGDDGWYDEMAANGPAKLRKYGEFLGKRYGKYRNILWVNGGDYNPPNINLVSAIALGIREFDPDALQTMHCAPEYAAIECVGNRSWLDLNTVYTYGAVVDAARPEYARQPRKPFILLESTYENEHSATVQRLRTQAYQADLSGAAGQIFGNNPMWHFDGPGLYPAPTTWEQALSSSGSRSMTYLRKLLRKTKGWRYLLPDTSGSVLVGGHGSGTSRSVAAFDLQRRFGLVYVPTRRAITINFAQLSGSRVAARWFDPSNGEFRAIAGSPFLTQGTRIFDPPGNNSSNFGDWVLVLTRV